VQPGAFPFLGAPASELADAHADLSKLWGSSGVCIVRRIDIPRWRRSTRSDGPAAQHRYDMLQLATACGHFDQSHLIGDFKEFSGMSPAEYLRQQTDDCFAITCRSLRSSIFPNTGATRSCTLIVCWRNQLRKSRPAPAAASV
jgi:AraC-like DNA-binding protein